ncbi:hypothetical protein FRB94_009892 [Tulasnella sp. JGI-2019a]|nr:hypothetical protein FRB94_009892 [Tulasnella sp. JGI-2019a]
MCHFVLAYNTLSGLNRVITLINPTTETSDRILALGGRSTVPSPRKMTLASDRPHHCHHALLVEDVLRHIFDDLPDKSLAVAAVTCRAWSDVALDSLWESADFFHLLSTLPTSFVSAGTLYYDGDSDTPISWGRFNSLAARIRYVRFNSLMLDSSLKIPISIAVTQSKHARLLPNIRTLSCTCNDLKDLDYVVALICPRVRTLALSLSFRPWPKIFATVSDIAPNIVQLDVLANHGGVVHDLTQIIPLLPGLKKLKMSLRRCDPDNDSLFAALAVHPLLEDLWIDGGHRSQGSPTSQTPNYFRALRTLYLSQSEDRCAPLLNCVGPHSELRDINIGSGGHGVLDLSETLHAVGAHARLESLAVTGEHSVVPLAVSSLKAIGACSSLYFLFVRVEQTMDILDADIEFLASHLTALQHFALFLHQKAFRPPVLTLRAYAVITASCSDIETIHLQVDASRNADCDVPRPHKRLRSVHVRESPIEDVESVALFFSRLSAVEDLTIKHYHFDSESRVAKKWEDVKYIIPFLRP